MLSALLKKFRRSHNYLEGEAFNEPVRRFLAQALPQHGFVSYREGKWVEEEAGSIRRMFEIWHFKGAVSAPIWGFSLGYVPHLNNTRTKVYWHRTAKSARLDLFPFHETHNDVVLERFSEPEDHERRVTKALSAAISKAISFFERVKDVPDLLPIFAELEQHQEPLGYWNYVNVPLAHAFTLRSVGQHSQGEAILYEFIQRHHIKGGVNDELRKRFEAAET